MALVKYSRSDCLTASRCAVKRDIHYQIAIGTPATYALLESSRQRGSNGLINESVGELWRNEKRQHMDHDIAVLTV